MNTETTEPSPSAPGEGTAPVPEPARKKRRWLRRLINCALGAFALLVVLVIATPYLVSAIAPSYVVAAIEREIEGTAQVGGVSFTWGGELGVTGLVIEDKASGALFSIPSMSVKTSFFDALRGRYHADALVKDVVLRVSQAPDGSLQLPRPRPHADREKSAPPKEAPKDRKGPTPLPDLSGSFRLENCQVILRDAAGQETPLVKLHSDCSLAKVDGPLKLFFEMDGVARGKLEGEATFARAGAFDPDAITARLSYQLEVMRFADLPPALLLAAGIEARDGGFSGQGEFSFRAPGELIAKGTAELKSLHVNRRGKPDEELKLKSVTLSLDASSSVDGTGTGKFSIAADEMLDASLTANAAALATDNGSATMTWQSKLTFAPLAEAAGRFLHVKSGYTLAGTSSFTGKAELSRSAGALARATLAADGKIEDFSARDARGTTIRFERAYTLALQSTFEPHKEAVLERLELNGGKFAMRGSGALGLEPLAVRESTLNIEADLDELARQLSTFLDLPVSFGGKARGALTATGNADAAKVACTANLTGLQVTDRDGKRLGPIDLNFDSQTALDLSATGTCTIERFKLDSDFVQVALSGSAKGFLSERPAASIAPALHYAVTLQPGPIGQRFGGYAPVLSKLSGGAATITGDVTSEAGASKGAGAGNLIRIAGGIEEAEVQLPGATAKDIGLEVRGIKLDHDFAFDPLALDPAAIAALVKNLSVTVASGKLSGGDVREPIEIRDLVLALRGDALHGSARFGKDESVEIDARVKPTSDAGDARAIALAIEAGTFKFPGVSGEFSAAAGPGASGNAKLAITLSPEKLNAFIAPRIERCEISGSEARTELAFEYQADRIHAVAQVRAPRLELKLSPPPNQRAPIRQLSQEEMQLDLDLEVCTAKGQEALTVTKGDYKSKTAEGHVSGHVRNLAQPDADLTLKLDGDLARIKHDLSAFIPPELGSIAGVLHAETTVRGNSGEINASGRAEVADLAIAAEIGADKKPFAWQEKKLSSTHRAVYRSAKDEVQLAELSVTSEAVSGTFSGRLEQVAKDLTLAAGKGDFKYRAEKLDGILRPWLSPAKLEGKDEKRVTFELAGRMLEKDPWKLIEGLTGKFDAEIPEIVHDNLRAGGKTAFTFAGGQVQGESALRVNGGTANVGTALDVRERPAATSKITIDAKQVGASAELINLLAMLHPIFAVAEDKVNGMINGKIDCAVTLEHAGPIRRDLLAAGWEKYPKELINGKGHVAINDFAVHGTPMLDQLLGMISMEGGKEVDFNPLDFTIAKGRVTYDRPLRMRLQKSDTSWTGSVGLDQTLDLTWEIPVSEEMVRKNKLLEYVTKGKVIVPVRGTASHPEFGWTDLLADLAKQAAAKEGEGLIEKGLGGLLGGGEKNDDAEKLLKQADDLWKSGKKAEAQALYLKLIDKYKKTQTYKQNKDRIRDRSQGK